LAGVQDGGDGAEGGVGDLGADGGLAGWFVPQDGDAEGLEQSGFEPGGEAGQDVSREREPVQEFGVGGGRGGLGQGLELGFELFAFVVEFGEPGADPGAVGLGGGVVGVGGEVFEFEDLGVLRGLDPGDSGLEGLLPSFAIATLRRNSSVLAFLVNHLSMPAKLRLHSSDDLIAS